jgi:RNA-splicing ligase RtcB
MLEYKGQYGEAKVMIDKVDSTTVQQIYEMLNHEAFTNPVAIMPDCHAGAGVVIGFTMPMTDKVIPNVIGVDIGCGMLHLRFPKSTFAGISMSELDERIRSRIPFGTNAHGNGVLDTKAPWFWDLINWNLRNFTMSYNRNENIVYDIPTIDYEYFCEYCETIGMDSMRAFGSLGTLGGGNHFIELGKYDTGEWGLTVHSGSRQFGLKMAKYHQKKAGKGALAYLTGDNCFNYLGGMVIAQTYAQVNRELMIKLIMDELDLPKPTQVVESVHNFIDFNDWIIRKGAIRSYVGELMVIPWNMEDGLIIAEGKSNPEWNYSAPHGAGRIGSRSWAKKNLSLDDARKSMKDRGIFSSRIPHDEIKEAYKDPKLIEDAIGPTAKILHRVTPRLNLKDK